MEQFIEKRIRSAKVFRISLFVIAVLWIGSFFVMPHLEFEVSYPLVMLLTTAVITCGIIYLVSYMPFMSSVKRLRSQGLEHIGDDIILERPTLPRSKIYCGQRAFFCKKPYAIIPYSDIAWTYYYERRSNGFVVEKAFILHMKDGKKFSLNAHPDEFQWLLQNYIIEQAPNIVIGYGAEQKARYKQLNPESVTAGKKLKRIWGIILMCIGLIFLVALIVNFKEIEIVMPTVLVLAFLGSGIILYTVGKK